MQPYRYTVRNTLREIKDLGFFDPIWWCRLLAICVAVTVGITLLLTTLVMPFPLPWVKLLATFPIGVGLVFIMLLYAAVFPSFVTINEKQIDVQVIGGVTRINRDQLVECRIDADSFPALLILAFDSKSRRCTRSLAVSPKVDLVVLQALVDQMLEASNETRQLSAAELQA